MLRARTPPAGATGTAAAEPLGRTFRLESPSALFAAGAGVRPVTSATADVDSHCVMCATLVHAGEPTNRVTRDTFNGAFNNKTDLRARSGRYVCGACMALRHKDFLQRYSKTYATRDGIFKLASNDDAMAFLANPPLQTFIALISTTKQQHLIWRTPVNYSRDTLRVRLGDEILTIRRNVLAAATRDWARLCELMQAARLKGSMPAVLNRNLDDTRVGMLRKDVQEAAVSAGEEALLRRMATLSFGEWWALNITRQYIGKPTPRPVELRIERSA